METKFYLRLPGPSFYENPYEKDSLGFHFDLETKTLILEKCVLDKATTKKYSLTNEDVYLIRNIIHFKDGFISKYMNSYEVADGIRFSHSVFSLGKKKIIFPDFLANFKDNDIFKRYRFYPDGERVLLYAMLRSLCYIAFKRSEAPKKDYPTSIKNSLAFKMDPSSLKLE